jgi:hypothetical protein
VEISIEWSAHCVLERRLVCWKGCGKCFNSTYFRTVDSSLQYPCNFHFLSFTDASYMLPMDMARIPTCVTERHKLGISQNFFEHHRKAAQSLLGSAISIVNLARWHILSLHHTVSSMILGLLSIQILLQPLQTQISPPFQITTEYDY